jgi:hypothetical protein
MQNVRQSGQFPLFRIPSLKIPQWEAVPIGPNGTSESEYPAGTGVVKERGRTNEPCGYRRAADGVQGSGSCVRPTTLLVGDGSLWEAS